MSTPSAAETPSAEVLKGLFEASLKSNPDKLGFTDTESKNFSKAFEDPEFRKMFGEYMDELQDPKNREETEAYIRQLEGEQKVPDGKELIRPTAGFVAKTYKEDKSQKESKGDKVWLNVVMSDSIAKPTAVRTDGGESWSVPYSLGPPHMEKDSGGENVATFDCCFHPEALSLAKGRQAFQNLLVQTAIEGVEEGFKRQNAPTKLLKDYHVLKNVAYKSGVISTMMVDKASKNSWKTDGKAAPPQTQPQHSSVNKLAEQLTGGKVPAQAPSQTPVAAVGDKKQQPRTKADVAAAVAEAQKLQQSTTAAAAAAAANPANVASPVSPSSAGAKANKGEPLIKKGFLEGRGGSKPAPKATNPLIQEISSTSVPTPKKPTTPRKTANSLAAAASAEAAAVANPPAVEEIKAAKPSTPRKTANSQAAAAAAAAAAQPPAEEIKVAKPSTPRKTANSQAAAAAAAAAAQPPADEIKVAKPSTPRKTANSQAAAAAAAAAATAPVGSSNPPLPPSVAQEAQALAALSEAEVQAVSAGAARSRAQHKERAVDSSLLNAISREQIGAGAGADSVKKGPIEPKYSITERGLVELGDFELSSANGGDGTSGNRVRSTRPKELVVRIELPRVASGQTGQVELDVSEKRLSLKYKDVYAVAFSLPYRVDDKKGAAKFEKASQALVVTLPVAKPTEAEIEMQLKALSTPAVAQQNADLDAPADPARVPAGSSQTQPSAAAVGGSPEKKMGAGAGGSKNPYLASVSAEEARAASELKEEIARAAEAAKQQALREANDPNRIALATAAQEEARRQRDANANADANATENAPSGSSVAFIPCEAFAGRKPGYVFKRSDVGLGYHWDANPTHTSKKVAPNSAAPAAAAKTEATPAVVPSVPMAELPPFEYRQTSQAITVLVNVTNIDAASVHTSYAQSSVQCSFTAAGKAYAFELRVNDELKADCKLDTQRCKHDVASRNMVLVLVKQATCLLVWEAKDGAQVLNTLPWSGKVPSAASPSAAKQQVPLETSASASAIDSLIQQASTMKFSSASAEALFDLD
jgi:hypothetical protein